LIENLVSEHTLLTRASASPHVITYDPAIANTEHADLTNASPEAK